MKDVRKWGLTGLLVVLSLELVWVLFMNFFLNSAALRSLVNRKPEKIRVEWRSARTFWPGDLRVRDLVVRGDQLTLQWALEVDYARAQVGILALLEDRFLARGLRAEGGAFYLRRHPVKPEDLKREPFVAPIPWATFELRPEGFDPKAIIEAEERPPPNRVWAIDLPGFRGTEVREIWIDEYRYEGDARVEGTWFLRAKDESDLERVASVLGPGRVRLGEETVLEVRKGRFEGAMPDVDLVEHRGRDAAAFLEGTATVEGGVPNVRFVDFYLGRFPGLDIRSGPGVLEANLAAGDGAISGTVALAGRDVDARFRGVDFRGDLEIEAHVRRWDLAGLTRDLSGTRGAIRDARLAGDRGGMATEDWWGEVELDRATITGGESWKLDANVTARVKDSLPLLAVLEARRDVPERLEGALLLRELAGSAAIAVRAGEAKIPTLEVRGDDFVLKSRMWLREEEPPRAIAYVKRGKISIGFERGGKRNVKVTKPLDWFEKHPLLSER